MAEKSIAVKPSEAYSFKGFDLKKLIHNEKDDIKLILSGLAGLATFLISGIANPAMNVAASTVVAGLLKVMLSTLDFWQSE